MLKLDEGHPVKRWLKSISASEKPSPLEQEKIDFLGEILNSQFNLITDLKVKTKVINLISELKGETNLERLLKSYLFLMIGNVTRSDLILRSIIQKTPRENYQGFKVKSSLYERITLANLDKILKKFSTHPADRRTFELFNLYILNYFNREDLITLVQNVQTDELNGKMGLSYIQRIAPELVNFIRLKKVSEDRRMKILRGSNLSKEMQMNWIWPFLYVEPLVSESMIGPLLQLEKSDPLWTLYLLNGEKLVDLFAKKGGEPPAKRRQFLRGNLDKKDDFMLTLYKLLEIGDIDPALIQTTSSFLIND